MEINGKIIVILGPTASGKSKLAIQLAKKFNGEVISADSRQVYKKLDIGAGKISKKEMRGIPHHCLNLTSPKKIFTVVDFKKCAEYAIEKILHKNKIPIIVGGTGLYIQAIVDNIALPEVKPNWKLRKELEKKTVQEIFKILKKIDPRRARNIDPKNPRRLIRAIEVAKALGKVPKISKISSAAADKSKIFMQVGVKLPDKILKKNIEKKVKDMLKRGLVKETQKLRNSGLSWKRIYELGFEYKYPALFLQGKINKEDILKRMLHENWQYAKRQMTWFKRDKRIKWVKNYKEARKLISRFAFKN